MLIVTVAGRLTKDAVLRYTTGENSTPVLGFTVAVDVGWGEKKHGVFVNCSLWGNRAQKLDAYLKKGKQVSVIGEADLRKWQTDQSSGSEITCKVMEITMQGGGENTQEDKPADGGYRQKAPGSSAATKPVDTGADFDDDDIPF